MNKRINATTEQKHGANSQKNGANSQKNLPKNQKKRTEVYSTLETEHADKRQKTNQVEGIIYFNTYYFNTYYILNI
jgi:hypothetical protein